MIFWGEKKKNELSHRLSIFHSQLGFLSMKVCFHSLSESNINIESHYELQMNL